MKYRQFPLNIICIAAIILCNTAYSIQDTLFNVHHFKVGKQVESFDLTEPCSRFFWSAGAKAIKGYTIAYERLIYHTNSRFSLNLGSGIAHWSAKNTDEDINLFTIYLTPKFWIINKPYFGLFINISAGGLTLLNKNHFDGRNLSTEFIFQDYIGVGVKFGRKKACEITLTFHHYSNAGIVRPNPGFDAPGVLSFAYTV